LQELSAKGRVKSTTIPETFRMQDLERYSSPKDVDTAHLKSLMIHFGGLTFSEEVGTLRVPNKIARRVVVRRALQLYGLKIEDNKFWNALIQFLEKDNPTLLAQHMQKFSFANTKKENFAYHNEFTTQSVFLSLLSLADWCSNEMERKMMDSAADFKKIKYWIDGVALEKQDVDDPEKPPKCVVIEFKNVKIGELALDGVASGRPTMQAVNYLRALSKEEVLNLKCSDNASPSNCGKLIKSILEQAIAAQVPPYVEELWKEDNTRVFVGHVILSVGTSHVLFATSKFVISPEGKAQRTAIHHVIEESPLGETND